MAVNVATPEQLALLFGLTDRRIRQLTEQGILQRLSNEDGRPVRGRYDLVKSVRAYCAYLRKQAALDDPDKSVYTQIRNRKMTSELEIAALKLQRYKRKLHYAEDVEFAMSQMFAAIRSRLLMIPERAVRRLREKKTFREIYDTLYAEFELALRDLSEYEPDSQRTEEYVLLIGVGEPPHQAPGQQLCR